MALTLEEVRAQIRQIQRDYANEDPDIIADAIATYAAENDVDQETFSQAMDTVRRETFRSDASAALAGEGTADDGTGIVKLTPIRSGEGVQYSSIPDQYTLADVQVAGRPLMNEEQLKQYLPYDPYDIVQRRAYEVAGPRPVTFYDQVLNRPVPVIGADGSVSMGNARLPSSGEMEITEVYPTFGFDERVNKDKEEEVIREEEEMVMSPGMRQQLQQIYLSSPNVEIAGQRIADYARSVGGLTSQQIANVINQVIPQGGEGLLETGSRLTSDIVEEAARAGNLDIRGVSALSTDPMERLRQLYTPEGATGTGAYTNREAAYRVLDEAARSGLSLDQVGSAFNLTPERTRQVLTDVGIDPSTYSTVPVAQTFEAQKVPVGSDLSQLTGIKSLSTDIGNQLIQPAVSSVQERLAGMYDPSQKGTAAELQTAQNIIQQGLSSGLDLNQIGASFNLTPEQTRKALIDVGIDTSAIPGFQKGGAVDTGEQGGGFFSSVGRGIAGLAGYAKDKMFGDVPEYMDSVEDVRFSGRPQSEYREEYYGEGPTFEERLVMEYGYPESPERRGSADFSRESRPTDRPDLPATSEILDARAHALGSALYGKEYGEEASSAMGSFGEFYDQMVDNASREDVEMDTRNNAVGRKILRNAGIMATTRDLTKMVDQQILDQLDRIMDRPAEKRRAQSPEGGPDLYFSRLDPRTLRTTTDPGGIINAKTYSRHPSGI